MSEKSVRNGWLLKHRWSLYVTLKNGHVHVSMCKKITTVFDLRVWRSRNNKYCNCVCVHGAFYICCSIIKLPLVEITLKNGDKGM